MRENVHFKSLNKHKILTERTIVGNRRYHSYMSERIFGVFQSEAMYRLWVLTRRKLECRQFRSYAMAPIKCANIAILGYVNVLMLKLENVHYKNVQ